MIHFRTPRTKACIPVFFALLVFLVSALPAAGQATVIQQNLVVPFAQLVSVPCAGELVLISGDLHILNHATLDANGGILVEIHFQPQGATGVGQVTGDVYRATGITRQHQSVGGDGLPLTLNFVNSFKIIGPGPNNNLLVQQTVQQVVSESGNITVQIHTSVTCM